MDLHEIIQRLTGEIKPIGESKYDEQCFENLGKTSDLLEHIVDDVICLVELKYCKEHSRKIIGNKAEYILTRIRTKILDCI